MDLRRSGFILPRFEFIIYGKLPFAYTLYLWQWLIGFQISLIVIARQPKYHRFYALVEIVMEPCVERRKNECRKNKSCAYLCTVSTFIHELHQQWNWTLETQVSGPWLPGGLELPGWSLLDRCSPSTTIFALSSSSLDLPPTTTSVLPQSKEERQGKRAHRHTMQTRPRHSCLCAR